MPPASSRSAATAGHAKAVSDKKAVHLNSKRKSIATDPALLQGSSDEDGEGPQDHEEQESSLQEEASRRTGSTSTSIKSAFIAHRSTAASTSAAANSSPRRSTRLSGEGLGSSTEACTSKDTRNGHSQSKESTALSSKLQSVVPNKRKAPSGNSVAKPAGNTHPTPPESDLDTASRMKASAVQKKSTRHSQSPTQKSKKLKSTSGEPAHPKPRKAPSPPPSDQSDDSDNFAFTTVGQGPSASAPSRSKPEGSQSTSHSAAPPATGPEPATSLRQQESQSKNRNNRTKPAPTKKTSSQASTSTDLLQSLKEVRNSGTKKPASVDRSSSTAHKSADAVIDRKGKRKAEESVGEEQDINKEASSASERSKANQQTKPPSKTKPKKGRIAELSREDLEDSQPSQPPDPGTPERSSPSMNVPINTQETPAIQRNLAMRAGLGHGAPPGTPGSARRSSSDMRGRRGSSIGNGLEALPHPSLPSDTLYRHIKADDPPAVRFRTLVTWSAHRLKEASETQSRTASTEVRAAVSSIMDNLIADLVEKRIDLSWQAADAQEDTLKNNLPLNPENEANQAKLESCQAWIQRLQEEDKARNARINQYKSMTERITKLMTPLPPIPASTSGSTSTGDIPDLLQPNWTLPIPRFKEKADMLAFGKKLLQPKPSTSSARRKSAAASSSLELNQDSDIVNVRDEYPIDFDEIRHQASSLAQNSYRVNQFLILADTFVTQHLSKTQATLAQISSGTRGEYANVIGGRSGSGKGKNVQEDARSTTRALLEGVTNSNTPSGASNQRNRRGMDAMNLLRAISRADTSKKTLVKRT